jgi:hypothetical protein
MIISKDINPERDFYYLGAKVIEVLSAPKNKNFLLIDVYEIVKRSENISLNLFSLTLDWLFISGVISEIKNGKIIKCF